MPIAIPVMPTPQPVSTPAGATNELGKRVAEVVTNDLKSSGLFRPLAVGSLVPVGFGQVAVPDFPAWQQRAAQAPVQGFVQANPDGTLLIACYLYDVFLTTALENGRASGRERVCPYVSVLEAAATFTKKTNKNH